MSKLTPEERKGVYAVLENHFLIRSNNPDDRETLLKECDCRDVAASINTNAPTRTFVRNLLTRLESMPDRDGSPRSTSFLQCFFELYGDEFADDQKQLFEKITVGGQGQTVNNTGEDSGGQAIPNGSFSEEAGQNLSGTKVFISYATEDHPIASRLYNDLAAYGVECWLDRENLLPGQNWKLEITRVLRESDFFLALLSKTSLGKRGYVQKEMRMAFDILDLLPSSGIFIVPVLIEDCEPQDERLREIHQVRLFPSYDEGLSKILKTLAASGTK